MESIEKFTQLFNNLNPDTQLEEGKKVSKKHLVNTLNYINFQDGTILINFKHPTYNNVISLQAKPQPCLGDTLDCLWSPKTELIPKLHSYSFLNFLLNNDNKMFLVKADARKISEEGISFILPETCYKINFRKVKRYLCKGIEVELIQNGAVFYGFLSDFTPVSFRIEMSTEPPQIFQWINPESTVHLILKNSKETLYSGECKIIRQTFGQKTKTFVLEPVNDKIYRFKHKEYRSLRYKLSPSPNIIFRHPFTQKTITLEVEDLSGSGFSAEEYYENAVLLPGMIIPELFIEIAHDFKIKCRAQVVHRNIYKTYEDETYAKCGLAILDMDMQDQVRLSNFLHQVSNRKSYVCNIVDLDALWKFFFEAGSVYPQRYAFIYANRKKFKETYEKLYIKSPTIARHFIYQDKGIIQGHISMLRFYENTWIIHQLASGSVYNKAGLVVLDQIGRYINDFYCLYSAHMDFIISYFRPNTKFSNRIFGGFTHYLNDLKGCSIDLFAYFHFQKAFEQDLSGWTLTKTRPEDLLELKAFYEHKSGGLMIHALDLEPDRIDNDELSKEYQKFGFKREKHLVSLRKDGLLKVIFIVTISDIGLDMSNLTNCIHAIILDTDNLPRNMLYSSLSQLSQYYEQDKIPIVLYPVSYAESQSIPSEKIYNLWVINTRYTDHYLKYMEKLLIQPKNSHS